MLYFFGFWYVALGMWYMLRSSPALGSDTHGVDAKRAHHGERHIDVRLGDELAADEFEDDRLSEGQRGGRSSPAKA